jgi:methylmalonyl-CoA mutase, C-terminal domain
MANVPASDPPRIRVVAGKPGLDGHDRGIKVVTRALRDAGMEVIYLGMRLSVEQIADTAVDEDADVVAVNFAAADHLQLVVAGGIIPDEDIPELQRMGIRRVFLPGTPIEDIVRFLREQAPRRTTGA